MHRKQVENLFIGLAHSQGFYGRLLRWLDELDEAEKEEFYSQFKDCKEDLDVILMIEQ